MTWLMIFAAAYAAASAVPSGGGWQPSQSRTSPAIAAQQASVARQRAAVRQQAANLSVRLVAWDDSPSPPLDPPTCQPLAEEIVAPLLESAAKVQGVDRQLLRAVMEQESGARPCSVSPKGAQGLMQLMPDTARDLQVRDPFDPAQNIQAGARYLKQLLDRYKGDIPHALAAYNAGPAVVDPGAAVPDIPETRGYVEAILQKLGISQ